VHRTLGGGIVSERGSGAALAEVLDLLDVRRTGRDRFRGETGARRLPRLFGGQAVAQALMACGRTVPDGRVAHSLHAYFLRPGDPGKPLELTVRRIRDGRAFSVRHVSAVQDGREVLELMSSFHAAEPGPRHQYGAPPLQPGPDEVPPLEHWFSPHQDVLPNWWALPHPFELRFFEEPTGLTRGRVREPVQRFWMRSAGQAPDEPLLHASLVAYASDLTLLDPAIFPTGRSWYADPVIGASLDYALWFHELPRADSWLLCEQRSPVAADGRAFTHLSMTDQLGRLVVTGAQEGLIREQADVHESVVVHDTEKEF
jgi:acyl-CoA thioesterase II